jgi:integrase
MVSRNPCNDVDPPRVERPALKVWDVATMAEALERPRSLRIFMPMLLAGMLGLRRGEIAALRWHHVELDFEQTRLAVRVFLRIPPRSPPSGSATACRSRSWKR